MYKILKTATASVFLVLAATTLLHSQSSGFYKHFKGTVGSLPATMDLILWHNATTPEAGYNYKGYYSYDKYQQPISLYGETDTFGQLVLHEYNWAYNDISFMGKLEEKTGFRGIWTDTSTNKTFEFVFQEAYPNGTVSFENLNFADSMKLWPNSLHTPKANFGMQVLLPKKNTEKKTTAFLKDQFFSELKGDSTVQSYKGVSFSKFRQELRDSFFQWYADMHKEEKPGDYDEMPFSLFADEQSSMSVLYNEKNLLSVGFSSYGYSGGAHGYHATTLASYDLELLKPIGINDVFLPNFEKKINFILAYELRKQFGLAPNAPLSEILFEDAIVYTANFCVTPKGILFLYNPYEIAAYAYGEIEIFVPFNQLRGILHPRWVQ